MLQIETDIGQFEDEYNNINQSMHLKDQQFQVAPMKAMGKTGNNRALITLSHPGTLTPILQLHNQLSQLAKGQYSKIVRRYKETSHRLKYLINHIDLKIDEELANTNKHALKTLVKECIKIVKILVMSTEYQKYGHVLTLFGFVVRKWEKINFASSAPILIGNAQKNFLFERIAKNEEQPIYNTMNRMPNTVNQLQILKDPELNNWIKTLTSARAVIQNPQCICCSRLFTKSEQIFNRNESFPNIIKLNLKILLIASELKKYLVAIVNSGGGVIIFGAQKRQSGFFATGLKNLNSKNSQNNHKPWASQNPQASRGAEKICEQIRESLKAIKQYANCYVEKVLIQTPINQLVGKQRKIEKLCLRISIQPYNLRRMAYLQTTRNTQPNYQMYILDQKDEKSYRLLANSQENGDESLYKKIHENYREHKQFSNCHQNIKCFPAITYMEYEKTIKEVLVDYFQEDPQQEQRFKQIDDSEEEEEYEDDPTFNKLEPYFRYEKTSLIVTRSEKYRKYIICFYQFLKQFKYQLQLSTPYKSYFIKQDSRTRPIFMLSHRVSLKDLSDHLEQFLQAQKLESKVIVLLPVQKTLQVQYSKLTLEKQKAIKNKFLLKYGLSQQYKSIDGSTQSVYFLSCSDYSQAIFLYMLLEQANIRPYFVGEDGYYKINNK